MKQIMVVGDIIVCMYLIRKQKLEQIQKSS
jgi:ssRNA-specific RNase YbeY (16S rRNA maturation enzyme)